MITRLNTKSKSSVRCEASGKWVRLSDCACRISGDTFPPCPEGGPCAAYLAATGEADLFSHGILDGAVTEIMPHAA